MANRILRDSAKTSPSLALLSDLAERTFWRIVATLDDHGRYHGLPAALMSACYPIGAQGLTEQRFEAALRELEGGDLLRFYEVDGRRYVYSPTWPKHQRLRSTKSRFPAPPQNAAERRRMQQMSSGDGDGIGDGIGDGGGLTRATPPPPTHREPETPTQEPQSAPARDLPPVERPPSRPPAYVANCAACVQVLSLLNELCAATFNAPGRSGEWMHMAHERSGLQRTLDTVRRQHAKLDGRPQARRWLAPSVLFKPENWDTTVNDTGPRKTTLSDLLGEAP